MLSCFSCVQLFAALWILPGSSVHGVVLARILEWVAISFFRGSSQPRDQACVSYILGTGRQVLYHSRHLERDINYFCSLSSVTFWYEN